MIDRQMNKYIASRLRDLRVKKHMTQVQLAEKAGINANAYAKIERGEREAKNSILKKLVKTLGVHSSDILPF